MLRLLHLADVHLGARHPDLGSAGSEQRERQWQAFERAVDLAIREQCALVLLAGDLFDSNAQPQRSVERAAAALGRLTGAGIHVVLLPGDADPYDAASVYRTYDLGALAAAGPDGVPDAEAIHVLVPGRMTVVLPALDVAIRGFVAEGGGTLDAALAAPREETETGVRLHVGVAHGEVAVAGAASGGIGEKAIGDSGLDYLALGGALAFRQGVAGRTQWADPGPVELLPDSTSVVGQALLASLDPYGAERVRVDPRPVGRTRRLRLELAAADFPDEPSLVAHLAALADPDLVCEVRLMGTRAPGLRMDEAVLEERLAPGFLHLRIRDTSQPSPPEGPVPLPASIPGAFVRDVAGRLADAQDRGAAADATDLREELDLGLELLAASTGMPV